VPIHLYPPDRLPRTPQPPETSGITSLRLKWSHREGQARRSKTNPAPENFRRFGSLV
jgi:hypothetical protein